jgi:hypothetical protein
MSRLFLGLALVLVAVFCPQTASADGIPIGVFAFDVFIPASSPLPGLNTFDIANETGGLLAPALGLATTEIFNGSLTLTLSNGSTQSFPITNVSPTSLIPGFNPIATFSSDTMFLSAVLTGTLDVTSAQLNDGTTINLVDTFSATLNPLPGDTFLTPCTFGSTSCAEAPIFASPVPEPGTIFLLGAGMAICWAQRKKFLKR